jgi:hypothetical protein
VFKLAMLWSPQKIWVVKRAHACRRHIGLLHSILIASHAPKTLLTPVHEINLLRMKFGIL